MVKQIRVGSSKEKPKKVIEVNVTKKHIFIFFIALFTIVYIVMKILLMFFATPMSFSCNDGTIETIEYQKTIYCGEDYQNILGFFDERQQKQIKDIILYNKTK